MLIAGDKVAHATCSRRGELSTKDQGPSNKE